MNYFTSPVLLEEIYEPLFSAHKSPSMAVIPSVDCSSNEGYIQAGYRLSNQELEVGQNADLVNFILGSGTEVLQHGLTHKRAGAAGSVAEFAIHDEQKLLLWAERGAEIIRGAFGVRPKYFVPPWDTISREGYRAVARTHKGLVTGSASSRTFRGSSRDGLLNLIPKQLPTGFLPGFFWSRAKRRNIFFATGNFLFLEHEMRYFSKETFQSISDSLGRRRVVVVVNHHWWLARSPKDLIAWHQFLERTLRDPQVEISTVEGLAGRLKER